MKRNTWPKGSKSVARVGLFAAIDLGVSALHIVRARFESSGDPLACATARCDRLDEQVRALEKVVALLRARLERVPVQRRPHYTPGECNEILTLMTTMGWTTKQIARRVLLSSETISKWKRQLRTVGTEAFIAPRQPINTFSDAVAHVVKTMHAAATHLGKRTQAAELLHASLKISASTVWRLKQRKTPTQPVPRRAPTSTAPMAEMGSTAKATQKPPQRVTARRANQVWHVDSTVITVRHADRQHPRSCLLADDLARRGRRGSLHARLRWLRRVQEGPHRRQRCPRAQARCARRWHCPRAQRSRRAVHEDYDEWCTQNKVRQRYGAIGQHGSIAVVERFIKTLKREHLRRVLVPLRHRELVASIADYQRWYNLHRPHTFNGGLTPDEKRRAAPHPISLRRIEPRERYPIDPNDSHVVRADLELHVEHFNRHRHLPIFTLRAAA